MVNPLITQAIADRASDIHIEPRERDVRIRYRVDGVLHEVMRRAEERPGRPDQPLKVMADINIAEKRVPQDGRISAEGRRQDGRPPRRDPADGIRREGRHPDPGQELAPC